MKSAILIALLTSMPNPLLISSGGYEDWKAPPPNVTVTQEPMTVRELAPHQVLVNEVVDMERLPYVKVLHYDLKIAINPEVLEKHGLRSGDSVPKITMDKIIEDDREFQKGVLR